MSFFELPAWRSPAEYRAPTWASGPEGMVLGVLPVELLVARTDTHRVLVDGLLVYPPGSRSRRPQPPDPEEVREARRPTRLGPV